MFDLSQIREYFPKEVQQNNFDMLREYLQCRILEIIYKSSISSKLIFIGGTALRIVHQTQRFSEDLDFDNKDLTWQDWEIFG
jgi:predicted nucleotidyltransferase component of viral defense system